MDASPRRVLARTVLLAACVGLIGCEKGGDGSNAPATADAGPSDPYDATVDELLARLANGDYAKMQEITASPLTEDLSTEAYSDLSKIVAWLGWIDEKRSVQDDVPIEGGGVRRIYKLAFEKEDDITLEVSLLPGGKVMGFHFTGDGFYRAEHGVIADQYQTFKVYDFHWLEADGSKVPADAPRKGKTINYHLVIGGIEAFAGEHHIRVSKMLHDASGKELLVEPIEYDVRFSENAEGIPRGEMTGEFDVPGPGTYELVLNLRDDVAVIETEHRITFEVQPG